MQIHDNILIAECSSYDFKEMLERKKVKSWLKSVSAFANTDGGSLFYGVSIVMGDEVHIDIYDDRVELVSPGAMLDGTQIQDRDIYKVPSMHRNPVIADMFTQLDYMEKRGSGLRKMRELTEKLPNFMPGKEPQYQTEAISFYTTFYNLNWGENGRIPIEEVANRVNSSLEKYSIDEESSVKTFGDLQKSSVKTFGDLQNSSVKQKRLGRTAQSILDLVISDGSISQDKMAKKIGVSKRAIEMQIANLKAKGLLVREGADHGGYWRIVINPKAEE
ncbi:putative DNA binding domain-containing protein [Parabacteroides merdae]|nr:putative DNA binding domain-containing protein [Parabacteroides merdae]MDB8965843.1 putative DNA binding domain-containing protein [Parabacteroides merdae]MDB8970411.1 putative DNA binding domain-containing protein [Parabacteroides merdae]MDB8973857.1 putative DNA binding domain-containing protein [Parabacteroides merdae]MDB8976507.1 putative DNA binding domain-containing protein [Parabacteroides merdae]